MSSKVIAEFNEAMLNIYRRAKDEVGYNATRFLSMVVDRGGLETAQHLLHASDVSEGYIALWERNRLDLTVEAMILQSRIQPVSATPAALKTSAGVLKPRHFLGR